MEGRGERGGGGNFQNIIVHLSCNNHLKRLKLKYHYTKEYT